MISPITKSFLRIKKIGSTLKKMSSILSWKSKTAGDIWQYHVPMSYWQTLLTMHDNDNDNEKDLNIKTVYSFYTT